uniref:Nitroreductase n=1 Tax=Caulobacter sp. (strain K31) TaxID=366602 RepID=B0T0M8_CAUSK
MTVTNAIRARRAHRDYLDKPVARSQVAALIETATWAPSGMNAQPWRFVVVDDPGALAALAAQAKARLLAAGDAAPAVLSEMLARPEFHIFYNAPVLVVICATTTDDMAGKDCCLAAQTLMLAAHDEGLGTCWIGLAESWLSTPEGKRALGLDETDRPIAPLILGWPATAPDNPGRRPAKIDFVSPAPAA